MHNDRAISTTPVQVEEIVFAHENVLKCLSKVLCIFDYISSLSLTLSLTRSGNGFHVQFLQFPSSQ